MSSSAPEIQANRFWLARHDPDVRPTINYPYFPAHELLRIAANVEPDKAATHFYGTEITFWDLQLKVIRMANGLIEAGIKKGDRIGIMLPNCPQFVLTFFALLHAGAIVVNLNAQFTADDLLKIASKTDMSGIIAFDGVVPVIKKFAAMHPLNYIMITGVTDFVDAAPKSTPESLGLEPNWIHYSQFLEASTNVVPPGLPIVHDDPAVIQFTTGTTGNPKGAILTHRNLVVAAYSVNEWAGSILGLIPVPRRTVFCVLPYSHVYGEICCLCYGIISRSTQILLPRFDPAEVMDTLAKFEEITYFPAVPTMFSAILYHPRAEELDLGKKMGVFNSGAAPCPPALLQRARDLNIFVAEGWGMSETTSLGITNPYIGLKKDMSIGLPYPDCDIKLIDPDTGVEVPTGERGEIVMRSPLVMKGYWNDPEETAKVLRDGWLYTGDIAYQDNEGYIFIVDRSKDIIISGGFNIYPRDIDEVIIKHPKVKDVITAGIPDDYRGEKVKSYVQLVEGQTITEAELIAYCKEHLAAYKVPREIEFRATLPRTAVGKALRRILRDEELNK